MTYIVFFAISICFAALLNKTKGWLWFTCFLLSVLIPSVLFGIRSETLGMDMRLYGTPIWDISQNLKSFDFSRTAYSTSVEKSYLFLNYFLAHFFTDIHWLLFFLALIECVLVLSILLKSDFSKISWLGYSYYLFIFFPRSINLIRQSFSVAFLFASSYFFLKKKWKWYFLFTAIAFCFHQSSIIAFLWPLIFWYIKGRNSKLKICGLFVVGLLGVVTFRYWGNLILFLGDKYSVYVDGSYKPHFTIFSLINVPFVCFLLMSLKKCKLQFEYSVLILSFLIIGICCAQMSMISVYLIRISTFFDLFLIWASMMAWKTIQGDALEKRSKKVVRFGLLTYPLLIFLGYFIFTGQGNIHPYISELFNQLWGNVI